MATLVFEANLDEATAPFASTGTAATGNSTASVNVTPSQAALVKTGGSSVLFNSAVGTQQSYIEFPYNTAHHPAGAFAVSCWFSRTETGRVSQLVNTLNATPGPGDIDRSWELTILSNDEIYWAIRDGSDNEEGFYARVPVARISDGNTHHIFAIYDGATSEYHILFDGKHVRKAKSPTVSGNVKVPAAAPLQIGTNIAAEAPDATVDTVRIWSGANVADLLSQGAAEYDTEGPNNITFFRPDGETVAIGTGRRFEWNFAGNADQTTCTLEISTDGFSTSDIIATGVDPHARTYDWDGTLPTQAPGTAQLRITTDGAPAQVATSNNFTIVAAGSPPSVDFLAFFDEASGTIKDFSQHGIDSETEGSSLVYGAAKMDNRPSPLSSAIELDDTANGHVGWPNADEHSPQGAVLWTGFVRQLTSYQVDSNFVHVFWGNYISGGGFGNDSWLFQILEDNIRVQLLDGTSIFSFYGLEFIGVSADDWFGIYFDGHKTIEFYVNGSFKKQVTHTGAVGFLPQTGVNKMALGADGALASGEAHLRVDKLTIIGDPDYSINGAFILQQYLNDISSSKIEALAPYPIDTPTGGQTFEVTWDYAGASTNMDIYYSADGTFGDQVLLGSVNPQNTNIFQWTPLSSEIGYNSDTAKIKVDDGSITDETLAFSYATQARFNYVEPPQDPGYFDILEALEVSFVDPSGGELFIDGVTVNVQWQLDNPDVQFRDPRNIRVDLDRNNAGTFAETVIPEKDATDLTATFPATSTPGLFNDAGARLRIVDLQTGLPIATSNYFTLQGLPIRLRFKGTFTVAS